MKKWMLIILALGLSACAGSDTRPDGPARLTEREQIALGCQGAQITVSVLDGLEAELARELSDVQVRAVHAAKGVVRAICANPPQTLAELQTRGFTEAAAILSRELAAYLASRNAAPPA